MWVPCATGILEFWPHKCHIHGFFHWLWTIPQISQKTKKPNKIKQSLLEKKVMVTTSKWNTSTRKVYGCHSQRFLTFPWPFPDIFLTNVKFPWPTELTISQILVLIMDSTLSSQPSPSPIYLCFGQVTCHVHELIVPQHNMQKGLIFFETQHRQILIMSVKCTKEF